MAEQSNADYRGSLGRYALFGEIAAGGMATVHLARLLGPVGFGRTVAIKRLHPHLAREPEFVAMFLEEARLAARVRHPNVVTTLDIVSDDGELFLVMEYVAGESLSRLVRKSREAGLQIPPRHVVGVVCGALEGLHAAHEAKSEKGIALGLVHRDVSPQNIHVGVDGSPRVLDFGIAKATNRVQETRTDQIKGKVAYMSPEQLAKGNIDRRADVYSASVVLWEALTGQRLFKADDVPTLVYAIINDEVRTPSSVMPGLPPGLDEVVMKGLARDADKRWSSAREMAEALEKVLTPSPAREIGAWVEATAGDALAWRLDLQHRIESETSSSIPPPMRLDREHSPSSPNDLTSGVVPAEPSDPRGEAPTITNEAFDAGAANARSPSHVDEEDDVGDDAGDRSKLGLVAMVLAGILLVGGGALFGLRWMQLAGDGPPPALTVPAVAPVPPKDNEPAIVIGMQRANGATSATSGTPPPSAVPTSPPVVVRPPTAPVPSAKSHECDVPTYVDARGVKHPKPQCIKR